MIVYQQNLSVRLAAAAAVIGLVSVGCQTAEKQTQSSILARSNSAQQHVESNDYGDMYVPPAIDESKSTERPALSPAPPAPVPPAIDDLTMSVDDGGLKRVSSRQSTIPKLFNPSHARSIKDFISGR